MGRHVAVAVLPLDGRIGARRAVPAGCMLGFAVAAVTLFNRLVAQPAIVSAAVAAHECTLGTFADRFTNHLNHPLWIGIKKGLRYKPGLTKSG